MSAIQNVLCFPPNSFLTMDLTRGFNRRLVWLIDANLEVDQPAEIEAFFNQYSPSAVLIETNAPDHQIEKLTEIATWEKEDVKSFPLCLQYAKLVRDLSSECMII